MSEVKVNKISPRTNCGTVTVGDSGDSVSVSAGVPVTVNGDLKSNALKATDGGSIISQSGTTITLGASGDTVSLASGASQTGFGRTGTVDWDTTPKTATFTAVSGDGFFCNTTGGAFTCNLPAGAAGAIVSLADYAATWQTNNLTVSPNGSDKIGSTNADVVLNTQGQSVTFIFVDSTQGWINVQDSTSNERASSFVAASGGNSTVTSGNYKLHIFTSPGTFTVSCAGSSSGSNSVSATTVAGGGGGGADNGAGAGAGGLLGATTIPVSAQGYPISVGAGGAGGSPGGPPGVNGTNSVFSVFTAVGGGGGQQPGSCAPSQIPGGSGGGASRTSTPGAGGTGTQADAPGFPGSAFGNNGGGSNSETSGGGGGAGAVGESAPGPSTGGNGGSGKNAKSAFHDDIPAPSFPNSGVYAGGGGAGKSPGSAAPGGGGTGTTGTGNGGNGTANTGGGGGGGAGSSPRNGGTGGSGIVIISYKFQ